MALKIYSIRLDEEEYETLKKYLDEYGDPELNIGFVLRQYMRSLNRAIPYLKKSPLDARATLSMAEVMFQNYAMKGEFHRIDGSEHIGEILVKRARKGKK